MARFISERAPAGWYPQVGEQVEGRSGKRRFVGEVLPETELTSKHVRAKRSDRPGVISINGAVLCLIEVQPLIAPTSYQKLVNELAPV